MSGFQRSEDIQAWQLGRELAREVYAATRGGALARDRALCNQARRACISIASNTAEGHERSSPRDVARFLHIAKASSAEVRSQRCCALDQSYLSPDDFERLGALCRRIGEALSALIRHLIRSSVSEPAADYTTSPEAALDPDGTAVS